jgi:uncharacterized membrane protein YqaE (UPF0057 family)
MPVLLLAIITFFIPPLGVFLKTGIQTQFWINLLLTIVLPWIGGMIHGMLVIFDVIKK